MKRILPSYIEHLGEVTPFTYAWDMTPPTHLAPRYCSFSKPGNNKLLPNLREAIRQSDLRDGGTVSFHHHLRNGDYVMNMVMQEIAALGLKDIRVAASSIFPIHAPLVDLIRSGVITAIDTNYMVGPVAEAVAHGLLHKPAVMRSHGGRPRAIETGVLKIDVAFIAAPTADVGGNINGVHGPSACGSLGYAVADSQYAKTVIAITDNLIPFPIAPISIPGTNVDYVVVVSKLGDPKGIISGTTRITKDPLGLMLAETATKIVQGAGLLKEGLSLQTGAGGASLAVAAFMRQEMIKRKIQGSFALGGVTGYFVQMLKEGLFQRILDIQCFDLDAVESLRDNPNHIEGCASFYANPLNKGAAVNYLDVMILGATEIDTNFNVNVTTGSDGMIMGGSGGHNDTAAGSKLSIVVTTATRGRLPIVVDEVTTITTPGETVDVLVTELGVAVNPRRKELEPALRNLGIKVRDINDISAEVYRRTGKPKPFSPGKRIVAVVEYRNGQIIDVIREQGR
ncbi:MAG: citrate lyase alpha subunit [Bacillota bacterium]|nr:MAG: citrate lyase alpha subunit [Bacillota bacterium]